MSKFERIFFIFVAPLGILWMIDKPLAALFVIPLSIYFASLLITREDSVLEIGLKILQSLGWGAFLTYCNYITLYYINEMVQIFSSKR